jgi:hypothetical protein
MCTITAFVKRHPLVLFFILAYTLTWPLIPLVSVSPPGLSPAGPSLPPQAVADSTKPAARTFRFRDIADEVGAYLFSDIAHIAGLIAAGEHPTSVGHAHITTSTSVSRTKRASMADWFMPAPMARTTPCSRSSTSAGTASLRACSQWSSGSCR